MTGPQHYAAAEELLEHIDDAVHPDYGTRSDRLKEAHVHAMLAVAASNVLPSHVRGAKQKDGVLNIDPGWASVITDGVV